jgi:hypothetical protein
MKEGGVLQVKLRLKEGKRGEVFCPHCEWSDVRRSLTRGPMEWLLEHIGRLPFRCLKCEERFHAFAMPWKWPKPRLKRTPFRPVE